MAGLSIQLNFRSNDPIYVQIMDQIRHKIATGELKPGDQLPTVRQLAADLRVNFNTIARAYRMLDEAGTISTQHGRGTYILEPETIEVEERLREEDLERLTHRYLSEAHRLGFSPEEVWEYIEEKLNLMKEMGITSISEED
jgi:GntR family transcriptional regulator